MNPDFPNDPHQEREARLSALILGQLPAEQAAEVRQQLNQDPELLKLYQRLQLAAELIREASATANSSKSPAPLPRLSHQRRERVLASFRTITPDARTRSQWSFKSWAVPAAAAAMILVMGAGLLPALSKAKSKAQRVTALPSGHLASLGSEQIPLSTDTLAMVPHSTSDSSVAPPPALGVAEAQTATVLTGALEPSAAVLSAAPEPEARRRFMTRYGIRSNSAQTPSASAGRRETTTEGGMGGATPPQVVTPSADLNSLNRNSGGESFGGVVTPGQSVAKVEAAPPQAIVDFDADGSHSLPFTKISVLTPEPAAKQSLAGVEYRFYQERPKNDVELRRDLSPVLGAKVVGEEIQLATNALANGSVSGTWADYDNDGSLDLFVAQNRGDRSMATDSRKLVESSESSLGFGIGLKEDSGVVLGRQLYENFAKDLPEADKQATVDGRMRNARLGDSADRLKKTPASAGNPLEEVPVKALARDVQTTIPATAAVPARAEEARQAGYLALKPANGPVEIQAGKSVKLAQLADEKSKGLEVVEKLERAALQTDASAAQPAPPAPVPQPEFLTRANRFSTFSMNVSDVSFKLAAAALEKGVMPEAGTIRSEEFINAFNYHDPEPAAGAPIAFAWEIARSPFAHNRDLIRFSVKTAAQGRQLGRPLNIVVLLDNSGSMERADRARIIQNAFRSLATQLYAQDKLSIVLFARTAQLWVDGVAGNQATDLADGISSLVPQGGTNLEEAMNLAYQTALRHYAATGINRVVLLTDGAANLGDVEPTALKEKVESFRKQGIALDCFGIGWEGYNDELMENLSRNGDGRYGFLNTPEEAESGFVSQLAGALRVAASDVKVQVEFNPERVNFYRQIGYAKHQLTKEQFRDNTVDAAEIGAAESGNALYSIEMNPSGMGPIATLRVRYKVPGTTEYKELEWLVPYQGNSPALEQASPAMRLATTASAFSEWLASNPYAGDVTTAGLLKACEGVPQTFASDARPKQLEWMIRQAQSLSGK